MSSHQHTPARTIAALISGTLLLAAACGGADDDGAHPDASPTTAPAATTAPTTTTAPITTSAPTTVPDATVTTTAPAPEPTSPPTTAEQVDDETWRAEVDAWCSHYAPILSIPSPSGGDPATLQAFVQAHREIHEQAPPLDSVQFSGPGRTPRICARSSRGSMTHSTAPTRRRPAATSTAP
jgi:hypothetical protein